MKFELRLLVVGAAHGTAGEIVSRARARGHQATTHRAVPPLATEIAGHDAIVADETLADDEVRDVIDAAREVGIPRVVLVSPRPSPAVSAVVASGLDWTIARPARLTDGGLSVRFRVTPGDLPARAHPISRQDLAHFVVVELERGAHVGAIVGVCR